MKKDITIRMGVLQSLGGRAALTDLATKMKSTQTVAAEPSNPYMNIIKNQPEQTTTAPSARPTNKSLKSQRASATALDPAHYDDDPVTQQLIRAAQKQGTL